MNSQQSKLETKYQIKNKENKQNRNKSKGENNMKKTAKIHIIKTRIMAALLAVVMMFSVFTFNSTKASAGEINPYETAETVEKYYEAAKSLVNRISDKDIEKFKKVGIQTVVQALAEFVPGGKTMGPAVSEFLGSSLLAKQTSLDDVNENINGLYDKIEQFEKNMKEELGNVINISNFDYSIFADFNSEIKRINESIKLTKGNPDIKEQFLIIGAQIGKDLEWKKGSSPFVAFTSVSDKINCSNIMNNRNLFESVYFYFRQRCMFNGEAIDLSREILDKILENYMAGYSVLMECLTAQLMVNAFENKEGLDPYYLDNISTNVPEIMKTIDELNSVVLGVAKNGQLDKTGTVSEKYDNIVNKNRMIFINKNKCDVELWGHIVRTNHGKLYNHEDQAVGAFNSIVLGDGHLNGSQIKDLADYAKEKGMTIRELLKANDFYTDDLPQGTNLVTSEAYDDLGAVDFLTGVVGSVHLHGLYKGINIDDKNPAEKEVRMWNCGCNGYFWGESWDFAEPGNAAVINTFD